MPALVCIQEIYTQSAHTYIMLSILSCFMYPLGKESLLFAVHPKRDKLLSIYTDIHPDTTITQYVICNSLTLLLAYVTKNPHT